LRRFRFGDPWKNGCVTIEESEESSVSFVAGRERPAAIEIIVNFGAYTGRTVMLGEIDRLSAWLLDEVAAVTVIAEDRHQIGRVAQGSVHQVRVEVSEGDAPSAPARREELEQRLLERVDDWARRCRTDRHVDLADF
jgi:hypothetical protein